jgi:hypothetical protein
LRSGIFSATVVFFVTALTETFLTPGWSFIALEGIAGTGTIDWRGKTTPVPMEFPPPTFSANGFRRFKSTVGVLVWLSMSAVSIVSLSSASPGQLHEREMR